MEAFDENTEEREDEGVGEKVVEDEHTGIVEDGEKNQDEVNADHRDGVEEEEPGSSHATIEIEVYFFKLGSFAHQERGCWSILRMRARTEGASWPMA